MFQRPERSGDFRWDSEKILGQIEIVGSGIDEDAAPAVCLVRPPVRNPGPARGVSLNAEDVELREGDSAERPPGQNIMNLAPERGILVLVTGHEDHLIRFPE